jgi:hypothetical protein
VEDLYYLFSRHNGIFPDRAGATLKHSWMLMTGSKSADFGAAAYESPNAQGVTAFSDISRSWHQSYRRNFTPRGELR